MKIISYNVNGIRAAIKKGFLEWLAQESPDIIGLQEVKATLEQVDTDVFKDLGYHVYWMPAIKKGYSGVAILSRIEPQRVVYGCGMETYDSEGRVLRIDFDTFSFMNIYMPSGTTGEARQQFKYQWLDDFYQYVHQLKSDMNLIIGGDYNIAHQPIDIHDPIHNRNTTGFLPEEREWFTSFLNSGFVDTFRYFQPEAKQYSWWSFRAQARKKNLGWRIDYLLADQRLENQLVSATILNDVHHSDHCPVLLTLDP